MTHTHEDAQLHADDGIENDVKHFNGQALVAAALCPACRQVRPLKFFQRYLTPGEAAYRGYDPLAKVLIETEKCQDCRQPKRTKPDEFSPAELRRKAELGHIPAPLADGVAEGKLRRARNAQRGGAQNRWDVVRAAKWDGLLDELSREISAVMQQCSYAKTKRTHGSVVAYASVYLKILRTLRSSMNIERRSAKRAAEHDRWQEYLTPYERNQIAGVWNGIDFALRQQGMRAPQAFARPVGEDGDAAPVTSVPRPKVYVPRPPTPSEGPDAFKGLFDDEINGVGMPDPS